MLFFKKKKEENTENSLETSMRNTIVYKFRHKALLNDLSQDQIENIIANVSDVDMYDKEMRQCNPNPDIRYLKTKYMLHNVHGTRKDLLADDIVKATCVGDIVGSKYEFSEHEKLEISNIGVFFDVKHYPTDDTALSVATRIAVLQNKENPDFRQAYLDAYKKNPNAGYGSSFVRWAFGEIDNSKGYGSFANGALMRLSFIPAYYDDYYTMIDKTVASVMATHNHAEAIKGSIIFATCIWMALHNYTKREIYDYCKMHYSYSVIEKQQIINGDMMFDIEADTLPIVKQNSYSLHCMYAVPFVIKHFYTTNSLTECMLKILESFCDSDTLCAMASGLCYAFYETADCNLDEVMEKYKIKFDV